MVDPVGDAGIGPAHQSFRPDLRLLHDERIVEQGQGLGRHTGHVATALGHLATREVEDIEEGLEDRLRADIGPRLLAMVRNI